MNDKLIDELVVWGADVDAAIERFMGKKDMYIKFVDKFPESSPIDKLREYMKNRDYENAVIEAHTLKGVTGNLGFTPLFEDLKKIVDDMRAENYSNVDDLFGKISVNYDELCKIIFVWRKFYGTK